jgi:hypothetical protein
VASRLGALRHHDVAAGLDCGDRVTDLPAHVDHEDVAVVAQLDGVAGHPEPGHEDPRPVVDERLHLGQQVAGRSGEEVDPEGLVGARGHRVDLVDHALEAHRRRPEAPEPAGLADRGHQLGVGDTAHAGQHHRVFDLEGVGEAGPHVGI